jgi:hypothetical protein
MLARGNSKLGRRVYTFSLPAGGTCPGQSPLCAANCYAGAGHFLRGSVQAVYRRNLRMSRRADFVERVVGEIRDRRVRLLRLHVSGDLYSVEYAAKWVEIAGGCPETRIWAYTRSWRVPAIFPALEELAALPNVRLWFSADADTGSPERLPAGVRVA